VGVAVGVSVGVGVGVEVGVGVAVGMGVDVGVGVIVGPSSCPGPQPETTTLITSRPMQVTVFHFLLLIILQRYHGRTRRPFFLAVWTG
jgi:hypothetical protein